MSGFSVCIIIIVPVVNICFLYGIILSRATYIDSIIRSWNSVSTRISNVH